MPSSFDRRVVPEPILELIRACQRRVPCHLAGGAALAGVHLVHRLSADVDLFCHAREDVRSLVRDLPVISAECGLRIDVVRDAGHFVRAVVEGAGRAFELDLIHESVPDIEPASATADGIMIESLADLRAAKLTCLLSRSEPRDLVDLLFLDRAGFPPERDLPLALRKDGGVDPGVLAWLLGQFPTRPLPIMLLPLDEPQLIEFRDALRERMRRAAVPDDEER
jgi:hypothetical protein